MSIPAARDPDVLSALLEAQERAGGRGAPVQIGTRWRMRSGRWPTDRDAECLLIESFQSDGWRTLAVLKPDGTWGYEP